MKLHLPNGLRKALLACLAAMTVSLPATLGTASGWAAVAYIASTRVYADFAGPQVTYTEKEWATEGDAVSKMTITEDTDVKLDSTHPAWSGNGEARHEMEYVLGADVGAGTVNLKLTSADAKDTQYFFKNLGDFKSLWLEGLGRWYIKDTTESFSNEIEDIYVHGSQFYIDASANEITDWKANIHIGTSQAAGNEGAFVAKKNVSTTGALDVVEDAKITFGDSDTAANMSFGSISGGGVLEINASSSGTLTLTQGGMVAGIHSSGANANVTFGGSLTLTGSGGSNIAGTLTVNEGGTLTLSGELLVGQISGTIGQLTLNEGAELGTQHGDLNIGKLVLNGDNASLAIDVTESTTISLTTLTANNHHLTIHLSGTTDKILSAEGYALFGDGGWNPAWNDSISLVSDSGRALKVDELGKVVLAFALQELTWSGSDGSNTLAWTDGGTGWTGGDGTFHNGDSVTLTGSGNTAMQVTVTGNITTGNLTISGDNTGGFTLAGSADSDTLHIGGDLSVSADVAFNLDVTLDGTITLNNNATLTVHQNFHHAAGESLTVDGTGTFRIDLSEADDSTNFNAAGYSFAAGIIVECDSNEKGWENFQNLTVLGTLKLAGREVVLQGTNVIATLDATGMTSNEDHVTFDHGNISTTFTNKVTMDSGYLDVRAGKVTLENGATLNSFSMNGGTLTVATGGLTTVGNMSLVIGSGTSGGQITVTDGGVQVGGNYNQDTGSLTVTAGGMEVTGSLTLKNSDLTVEGGNVSVGGDLVITKEGDDAHSTFTVSQGDLEVTGALQVNSSGAILNVTNGTLKLHKGLATSSWTPQVNAHAVEFLNEGEADYDGNLKATDVTMDGAGTQGLHSGQTGYFDISGNVTVKNGTLKVYTNAAVAASHVDGVLQVEGGTFLWEASGGATMTVGSVNQTGGTLTVSGNMNVTGNVSIAQGATSFSVTGKTLSIGGHLSAGSGSITLGAGGELVLQSGTATDNTLGTLTLSDNAMLGFSLVDGNFTALTLGTLTLDGHTLTIDLGTELAAYLAQHNGSATLDLFSGAVTSTLQQAWRDGNLALAETYGYTCEVNERGQFVFSGEPTTVTWSEESHSDNLTLVWENGNGEGRWDGQNFAAWNKVELIGNSATDKTITLKGAIQANSVTISGGTGKFVFGSDASGGSLEAAVITVGVNTDFNVGVSVASSLTVQGGVTLSVGDSGSLHMDDGAGITVGNGSSVVIAADKLSHEGEVLQFAYSGGETGSGEVEIKLTDGKTIIGLSAAKGVTLKLTNTGGYSVFKNVTSAGEVIVAGAQVILDGTNNLVNLSDGGTALTNRFILNDGHTSTTLSGNLDLSASALDVRDGELVVENGTITAGKGLLSNNFSATGYVKGKDLITTVGDSDTKTYYGALTLSGSLTKKGAGTQELQGGSNNDLSVTGTVTIEAGALNWGQAGLESSMGSLAVTSGTFKLLGGTLTVGAISAENGTVDLGSAAGTLKVTADSSVGTLNLSGANATLDLSGKLTVNALSGGDSVTLAGLTMGAGGHLVLGTGIDSAINLGTITLTGAADLTLSGTAYSGLRFSGTWADGSAGNKLTIHLNDTFLESIESGGYQLFESSWAGHVTFATGDGSEYAGRVQLDDSGTKVVITARSDAGLVWNVDGTDDTWSVGCTNWVSGGAWSDGSNATFSDARGDNVTISGTVAPQDVNVTQGTWTFNGEGALSVGGKMTVGTEGGAAAHVTFGSTGGITLTGGLKLQGNGTTVTVGATNENSGGLLQFGDIELGEGTELVLTGAQSAKSGATNGWKTASDFSNRPTTAHGAGSIVLEGLGEHEQAGQGTGILWAFTGNTDTTGQNHEIGNLRLRTHENTGTLLKATGEMGGTETHGFGNFTNIWVEAGNSLRDEAGALAKKKHSGNLLHLAGSGVSEQDANYASKKGTYDGALVLATSTENVWNIQAEADATISVKNDITLSGTLASQGNTLTIKTADGKTTTLKGAYTAGSKEDGTKGTLELSGGAVVLEDGFSMAGGEGTLKVSGGTVSSAQTLTLGNVALNGGTLALSNGGTVSSLSGSGTLQVKGGTLTLTTVDSPTLTSLALGQGSTAGNLVVKGGSFTISDGWTWVEGSKLTLSVSGQQITLSGMSELNGGNSDTKLTIDLTEAFLGGDKTGSGSVQLFASSFDAQWKDYFKFTINGADASAGNYDGLALADNGMLTWGQVEPPKDLTWDKADENNVWDADGTNQNWTNDETWHNGGTYTAIFANADGEAVTLSGELKAAGVQVKQGGEWVFKAGSTADSLSISGDLTVGDGAKLTVGAGTSVTVSGAIDLGTSGELALASDVVFGGAITAGASKVSRSGSSGLFYMLWNGGGTGTAVGTEFLAMFGDGASKLAQGVGYGVSAGENGVTLSGDFTIGKNFKVSGSGTATFSGNVTMGDDVGITIDEGATLDVTGSLVKNATSGEISVNGDGNLRISFGGDENRDKFQGLTTGARITVSANITETWGFLQDVRVLGEMQVGADKEIIFLGTNTIGKLSDVKKLNLYVGNTKTTISQTDKLTVGCLSMQEGTLVLNGELEVNGAICNDTKHTANGGHIEGTSLTVNLGTDGQIDEGQESGGTAAWLGGLKLSGNFTKTGDGLLVIGGGSGNAYDAETDPGNKVLDIDGTVSISGGRVVFGQGAENDMTVGKGITLSGGGSVFEWRGKKLTVSGGTVSTSDGASLAIKYLELGAGESRLNFAAGVNVSGLKLTLTGFELSVFQAEGGYQLFDSSCWQTGWKEQITLDFDGLNMEGGNIEFNDTGALVWSSATQPSGGDLTWNVGGTNDIWGAGDGNNNWNTGQAWEDGSNATFSHETGENVTISGTVAPKNVNVVKGTWTFTGSGSLSATGSITVGTDGTAAHVTFGGAVSSKGLNLRGEGTTVKFSGAAKKDFGGTTDSPSIHLGVGTELVVSGTPGGWKGENGALPNYAEGEGSIVMEGTGEVTNAAGSGFLFSFVEAGDANMNKSIGALRLRSNAEGKASTLVMSGEMSPGEQSGHSLGYFKEIYVEAGSTLNDASGALGAKKHTGNVLHLAGTGAAGAGALIISHEKTEDWRQVEWDIVADADALISVKKGKTFNGTLGAQGNTLTLKTSADQTTTLAGVFTAGDKDGTEGTLGLSGGTVVLGEGFSMKDSKGTLKVNGSSVSSEQEVTLGKVVMESGTLTLTGGGTASALSGKGTLKVNGGTLTVGTAAGATLTNLALTGNLAVNAGSFSISDGWTWGEGSRLTLGGSLQNIELSGTGWADKLAANGSKLTITLGGTFLDGVEGNSFALFSGEGVTDFTQYFDVDLSELSATYEGLTFNADGTLSWGEVVGPVKPGPGGDTEPEGDVFWGGGEDESDLTWGSTGDDKDFDTKPDGSGDVGWKDGTNVHFLGKGSDESRNVGLAGDIKTGDFKATGTEGQAKFSFGSEGKKGLTVGGNMSVTHAELTFTKDVDLTVDGSVTLTESTLSVEGEAEFKGEVSGTGTLDTGTGGRISLSRTGEGGFKGKVTGTGTLATSESGQVTLSGDVSGFEGTLDIGADGMLTLSGDAVGDEVKVKASGSGTLAVNGGDADVTFSGTVGGVTLRNAGSGELTVTSQVEGNGNGTKLDGGKGGITLGGTGSAAVWNGEEVTGGDITLSNVTLAEGGLKKATAGAKVYVDTALAAGINTVAREATLRGGIVDVKGMDAGRLDGITVNAHGQLTEVTGTYKVGANKQLTLHFTAENVVGNGEAKGLIVGRHIEGQKDFNIEFSGSGEAEEQGLRLEFDEAAIIEALRRGGESEVELLAVQGGTWKTEGVTIDWTKLGLMDLYVTGVEFTDVGLKIAGSTRDLYVVLDGKESDSHESKAPGDMAEKLATVVTAGQTLTLNWAEDGTVRNLVGAEGAKLEINDASGQGMTVTLDNTHYDMVHDDRYPTTEEAKGEDTTFAGAINGGKGVDIVKSGLGVLTVGGDYTLTDGDTRLEAGALRLSGTGNRMKSLTFAYGSAPGAGEERGLLPAAGSRTEIGSIVEDPKAGSSVGNEVTLSGNAELTLTGESTLANTAITDDGHGGVLRLAEGASLSFTGDKGISDTAVDMKNAVLDLGASKSTLTGLNGSGTLKSAAGGEVKVGGGTFTGTLGSSAGSEGAGTLVVAGEFTLDKVASEGDAKMGVRMEGQSHLTVKAGEKQGDGTDTLNFGDIELGGGRLTVDFGGRGINGNYVTGNVIGVGEDGVLEFVSNGAAKGNTIYTGFTVAAGLQGQVDDFVKFSGVDNLLNDYTVGVEGREVVLTLQAVEENRLAGLIPGAQKNGLAGAEMMWGSLKGRSQGELLSEIFARPDSAYARLAFYLSQCYGGNADATGLDRTLAAAAGSAISTLGAALGQDVHRQLSTIRNRTTGMGGAAHEADDKLPQWHAWIQGEGNYHKLDADGLAPGYTLNSWGGTVGVDADVTRRMTLGLAVTAMYGDLKPDSPDSATGDLDTAYLSAFARVAHGAWIHTFAVSGGFADVKLDRTVSYGGDSYRTSGSTDGYALGVLYEVGYTRLMNAAGTVALQPVFNVEWRHASIDGYTESGCDAGVNTDDITQDVVTFGAGARAQFAVGANMFNHAAVLETRALVKADVGDRSGTASNAMVGDTARAEVESAEVGTVGVELGAGISVPVGSDTGSVFVDGSVEFRSGWTSANATVGYRMNF